MKRTIGHMPRVLTNQRREKSLAKKRPLISSWCIVRFYSYFCHSTGGILISSSSEQDEQYGVPGVPGLS